MKVNKIFILVVFIVIFLLGIVVGFGIKSTQSDEMSIDLNPFPDSCQYDGKSYKSGESFPAEDGCNSCTCKNGKVRCTLMACE